MGTRFFCVALLAASFACGAQDLERLRIEVVPVWIGPDSNPALYSEDPPESLYYVGYDNEIGAAVYEAMELLQVLASLYEVSFSTGLHFLSCDEGIFGVDTACRHNGTELSADQMNSLQDTLQGDEEPAPGKITLLVLTKAPGFVFTGGLLGQASVTTWTTWLHEDMHWSTTGCAAWAHLHVPTIAHELGHCFGLHHNGVEDPHAFIGDIAADRSAPYVLDLTKTDIGVLDPAWLKPSNFTRIRHHFGALPEKPVTSAVPMSRTFH